MKYLPKKFAIYDGRLAIKVSQFFPKHTKLTLISPCSKTQAFNAGCFHTTCKWRRRPWRIEIGF